MLIKKLSFNNRGQSLTELAIYLAVVLATVLTMRLYVQRSLQAKYKGGADYIFSYRDADTSKSLSDLPGIKKQYDPYYRESNITVKAAGESTVGFPEASINQTVNRTGWERTNSVSDAD